MGIVDDRQWAHRTIELARGDSLVLYTDGITEAHDGCGLFGEQRLAASLEAAMETTRRQPAAQRISDAILADVRAFVGEAPQSDDIALVVVTRAA